MEPALQDETVSNHRIDNQLALWDAEHSIKTEVSENKKKKKARTYFVDLRLLKNAYAKKLIRKGILLYQCLKDEDRERYLNERMSVRKHDGSIFIGLKGQKEVFAKRNLTKWETLGHFGGKQFTEDRYMNNVESMRATRTNIDSYSYLTTDEQFISGFILGNVTSLINACMVYSESEKGRVLPKRNVAFMRHQNNQGIWIVFLIALNNIKAGATLWADYGKDYWDAKCCPIEISDSEGNAK